jgi:hydroxymethylpyrimidine/phosphomethylpyrimidine kinase
MRRPVVLTIAGSDSSGGAGIEADLKTMCALGVYGTVALTSVTAQNTLGVTDVHHLSAALVGAQIDAVVEDLGVASAKTGMLATREIIQTVAERSRRHEIRSLVVDPVMVATSGARLIEEEAIDALRSELLPISLVFTPNIAEASVLAGLRVESRDEMVEAGERIRSLGAANVLVKGGHLAGDAADVLCSENGVEWFEAARVGSGKMHGTGCTLSAAVASWLALGRDVSESVRLAKRYVTRCIEARLDMGKGSALLDHLATATGGED